MNQGRSKGTKELRNTEYDMIDTFNKMRMIHKGVVLIKNNYDKIKKINEYIKRCNKNTKRLGELSFYICWHWQLIHRYLPSHFYLYLNGLFQVSVVILDLKIY